jgi:hypothetical protein
VAYREARVDTAEPYPGIAPGTGPVGTGPVATGTGPLATGSAPVDQPGAETEPVGRRRSGLFGRRRRRVRDKLTT